MDFVERSLHILSGCRSLMTFEKVINTVGGNNSFLTAMYTVLFAEDQVVDSARQKWKMDWISVRKLRYRTGAG